eukprot:SAG11_NODE_4592_length_1840_cov_1.844917_3_plen_72_part_00
MVYWDVQLGPGPEPANTLTRVPGLYTALSADGVSGWVQQEPWGVPRCAVCDSSVFAMRAMLHCPAMLHGRM